MSDEKRNKMVDFLLEHDRQMRESVKAGRLIVKRAYERAIDEIARYYAHDIIQATEEPVIEPITEEGVNEEADLQAITEPSVPRDGCEPARTE